MRARQTASPGRRSRCSNRNLHGAEQMFPSRLAAARPAPPSSPLLPPSHSHIPRSTLPYSSCLADCWTASLTLASVQCDEAHPTCNNCKKSKRECLGYDPIFKQSHQGPTAIQPAPNSQSPAPSSTVASTPTLPSTSHNYQPPVVPSSYPPSGPSSITFDSPVSSTAQSIKTEPGFDYSAAIDPALQGADLSTGAGTPPSPYQQTRAGGTDEGAGGKQQLKGGTPPFSLARHHIPTPAQL